MMHTEIHPKFNFQLQLKSGSVSAMETYTTEFLLVNPEPEEQVSHSYHRHAPTEPDLYQPWPGSIC